MAKTPAIPHEFRREKFDADGSCLYTSFRYLNGTLQTMDNKRLRYMVANYIRNHETLHISVLQSGTLCKTVEEYCSQTEKHNLRGGEPEIRALAMVSRKLIRLVSRTKTAQGKYVINILTYGEDIESFKQCVHILYDEENKGYDPLYLINKQNSDEKLTIFPHGTFMQFGGLGPSYEAEEPKEIISSNESEQMFDMVIAPNANTNFAIQRKSRGHASLSFSTNTEQEVSSTKSNHNDVELIENGDRH